MGGISFPIGFFARFMIPHGRAVVGTGRRRTGRAVGQLLARLVRAQRQSGRRVLQGGVMILTLLAIAAVILLVLLGIGKSPAELQPPQSDRPLENDAHDRAGLHRRHRPADGDDGLRQRHAALTERTGQPGNVLVLSDGATDEIISNLTVGDLAEIENLPEVVRVRRPADGQPRDVPGGQPAGARRGRRAAETPLPASPRHRRPAVDRPGPRPRTAAGRKLVLRGRRAGSAGRRRKRQRPPRRWFKPCSARASPTNWPAAAAAKNLPRPRTATGSTWAIPSFSRDRNVDRRGHPEVGRLDLQFRNLGQAVAGRPRCSARTPTPRWCCAPRTPRRPRN